MQRHIAQAARAAAIGKGHVVQRDAPSAKIQINGVIRVWQRVGFGQRFDGVLDLSDIRIHAHQGKTDPARHLRKPQTDRAGDCDITRRCRALLPQVKRDPDQQNGQHARQRHQPKAEARRHPAEAEGIQTKLLHRVSGGAVLVIGMGEQLNGFDVRDRVHHLPRHHRPRSGAQF